MALKEENQKLNEKEEKDQYEIHHDFITGEKSFSCSQTENTFSENRSHLNCQECGKSFNQHGHNSHWREAILLPTVWKKFH